MSARVADVFLPLESPQLAQRIARALAVEAADGPPRSRATVTAEGSVLHLHFEAEDTRGLRAAANSFLRWADAAIAVARVAERASESFKLNP